MVLLMPCLSAYDVVFCPFVTRDPTRCLRVILANAAVGSGQKLELCTICVRSGKSSPSFSGPIVFRFESPCPTPEADFISLRNLLFTAPAMAQAMHRTRLPNLPSPFIFHLFILPNSLFRGINTARVRILGCVGRACLHDSVGNSSS